MADPHISDSQLARELVDAFVPVNVTPTARVRARRFVNDGIIVAPNFPDTAYDDGGCWEVPLPRTHARYLHGMMFLADWHATVLSRDASNAEEVQAAVTKAAQLLLRWQEVAGNMDASSMAYHDETTAQRLMQVCHFLDDHAESLDRGSLDGLVRLAESTAELLITDEFHAGANNHGMFQDLALLRFAASSDVWHPSASLAQKCLALGVERLVEYFSMAFASDGVHVENSPSYHFMVANSLRDVIPVVRAVDPEQAKVLEEIYQGAERFAIHSVFPDGAIAPLGDTKVIEIMKSRHRTTFTGEPFRYAISQGREGVSPAERSVVFSAGGYAMHRTAWGDTQAYVMTFKASYLAHYHHHCDDLALTLWGRGRWLLSEAGPYGYDYQDPLTKYAYSQHAHNVVLIDGRSLPRRDEEPGGVSLTDLTHEPAVSGQQRRGLRRWFGQSQRSGSADLAPGSSSQQPLMRVAGVNKRFAAASHTRQVSVTEPEGNLVITVTDTVEHDDGQEHGHEILWHVGPDIDVTIHGQTAQLFAGLDRVLELTWTGAPDATAGMVKPRSDGTARAMRFPAFGKHKRGRVIRIATRGRRLDLTTVIRAPR